uniref:Uncharacterized protein n=1 Tax=Kalanchoe fedtschenkoi TaxID=63787 RepID=A0A7N0R9T1_KALFE
METVYMQAGAHLDHRKMAHHQYHRRGPIIRYNSIDNGLLASPYPYHGPSHRLVHVQPLPPLLPLPTTTPQHSSLSLRTSSGKLNRAVRKPSSHGSGNLKSNPRRKKDEVILESGRKKTTQPGHSGSDVGVKEDCEDHRVLSDLVFAVSPHPSSLPLPKFFMRQRETTAN